jgi:hypothetical protein
VNRTLVGLRAALIGAAALAVVGAIGWSTDLVTLTATVGPTAYVFAAHPATEVARARNAILGHSVAIGAGLASLAVFGLWVSPSVVQRGIDSWPQIGAAAVSLGVTLLLLDLLNAHHSPAASTALLVSTGLARWGHPLEGLVVGLAVVIVVGGLLGKVPILRERTIKATRRWSSP